MTAKSGYAFYRYNTFGISVTFSDFENINAHTYFYFIFILSSAK